MSLWTINLDPQPLSTWCKFRRSSSSQPNRASGAVWKNWPARRNISTTSNANSPRIPRRKDNGINRRDVLKLMGASAALAGLTACTKMPTEKIVPYVHQQPEDFIPGKPLFYATAMPLGGYAHGVAGGKQHGPPH